MKHSNSCLLENRYKCDQCNYHTSTKSHFDVHQRTHTKQKPFTCDICDKAFSQKSNLTKHHKVHSGERPYKCPQCSKSFIESTKLTKHLRVHAGEKQYQCSECGKTFAENRNLTQHFLIHSGQKPHKCSICDRSFRYISDLREHQLVHSDVKTQLCSICGHSFKSVRTLKRHLDTVHNNLKKRSHRHRKVQTNVNKVTSKLSASPTTKQVLSTGTGTTSANQVLSSKVKRFQKCIKSQQANDIANQSSVTTKQLEPCTQNQHRNILPDNLSIIPASLSLNMNQEKNLSSDMTIYTTSNLEHHCPKDIIVLLDSSTCVSKTNSEPTLSIEEVCNVPVPTNIVIYTDASTSKQLIFQTGEVNAKGLLEDSSMDASMPGQLHYLKKEIPIGIVTEANSGKLSFDDVDASNVLLQLGGSSHVSLGTQIEDTKSVLGETVLVNKSKTDTDDHIEDDYKTESKESNQIDVKYVLPKDILQGESLPQYIDVKPISMPSTSSDIHKPSVNIQSISLFEPNYCNASSSNSVIVKPETTEFKVPDDISLIRNTLLDSVDKVDIENTSSITTTYQKSHNVCQLNLKFNGALKNHHKSYTSTNLNQCIICFRTFNRKSNLIQHRKIHSGKKDFSCDICGKCFVLKSSLKSHHMVHADARPYKCDNCTQTFKFPADLTNHKRIHTGLKPYQCPECGKCFSLNSSLNRHSRLHSGIQPYMCHICGRKFSQIGNMHQHMQIHKSDLNLGFNFLMYNTDLK